MMPRPDFWAVREIGRATQGVRLIRLDEGDTQALTLTTLASGERE
jgi:hypothetical protein